MEYKETQKSLFNYRAQHKNWELHTSYYDINFLPFRKPEQNYNKKRTRNDTWKMTLQWRQRNQQKKNNTTVSN